MAAEDRPICEPTAPKYDQERSWEDQIRDQAKDSGDEDALEQIDTMLKALKIFLERRPRYGDAWRAHGALANLLTAARKVDRLMEEWWHNSDNPGYEFPLPGDNVGRALDDAYDLINYAVFFIRLAKEGNYRGKSRP